MYKKSPVNSVPVEINVSRNLNFLLYMSQLRTPGEAQPLESSDGAKRGQVLSSGVR